MKKEISNYLDWKASYAPRASIIYEGILNAFITHTGKEVPELHITDVVKYQQRLKSRGRDIYFPTVVIKNFFKWMVANKMQVIDPWLIKPPKKLNRRRTSVTDEEFRRMIATLGDTYYGVRDKLIVHLLWHTGMRVSEVCGLKLGDLVFEQRKAIIKNKKNANHRMVIWAEETQRLLIRYLGVKITENSSEYLFMGKRKPLNTRQIQRICKRIGKKAKIKRNVTPHQFRHGWAHYRMERGAPITFIQKGLGHTNPASTLIYEQYSDRGFEKKARRYFNTPIV